MMKKLGTAAIPLLLLCSAAFAQQGDEGPQDASVPANPSVRNIQRTMRTLNGEANVGEPVKVLFYGQSITAQSWTLEIAEILKARFPESKSNMVFVNNTIGGYQADKLSRIADARLYPEYPDLVIFHDYGKLEFIEEMIRRLRKTTAEIVIWTPHVRGSGESMKQWKEEHVTFGFAGVRLVFRCSVR